MTPSLAVLLALGAGGFTFGWTTVRSGGQPDAAVAHAYRSFTERSYFRGLDGLRAISVVAVLWCHLTGVHQLDLLNQGNKGVQLFFAISGFLVTTLLLRERRRTGQVCLRSFYIRRTLRIFPLYFAVLALYCVLVFATMRGTPKAAEFWQNLPAFATYTSNWFVSVENGADHGVTFYFAWSLATEEQFYLFWPPLLAWALAAGRRAWMPAVVATGLLALQAMASEISGGSTGTAIGSGLLVTAVASLAPPILYGAVLAVLLDHRPAFNVLAPALGHRLAPAVFALFLLSCLQLDAPGLLTGLVMALLVASVCLRQDSVLHPVLDWQPMAHVGTISYGIYLMHMLAANAIRKVVGQQMGLAVFLGTVALSITIATLSHRWFETPVMKLRSRFTGASQPNAAAAPVPARVQAS